MMLAAVFNFDNRAAAAPIEAADVMVEPRAAEHVEGAGEGEDEMQNIICAATLEWAAGVSVAAERVNWARDFTGAASMKNKHYLVYMPVQCGKTRAIIAMSQASITNGASVIILVQNFYKDRTQLFQRFLNSNKDKIDHIESEYDIDTGAVDARELVPIFADKLTKLTAATLVRRPRTIICLANGIQMRKLNRVLDETPGIRYNVIMDESDTEYKDGAILFTRQMRALHGGCDKFIGITATTFDTLVKDHDLSTMNLIVLRPAPNYKGLNQLVMRAMQHKVTHASELNDNDEDGARYSPERDSNLLPEYVELEKIPIMPSVYVANARRNLKKSIEHPVICLHKTSNLIKVQQKTQDFFRTRAELAHWTSIVHNGEGLRLYAPNLVDTETLPADLLSLHKYGAHKMVARDVHGYFMFSDVQIQDMLEFLQNRGARAHSHIVIIAGRTADRGTSYVSSTYKWHLTHEYLLLSNTAQATVSRDLQALRICGVSDDDLPRTLITTQDIIDNCRKAYELQEKWILDAEARAEPGLSIQSSMCMTVVDSHLKPKHKISRFRHKHLLNFESNVRDGEQGEAAAPRAQEARVLRRLLPDKFTEAMRRYMDPMLVHVRANPGQWILRSDAIAAARDLQMKHEGWCGGTDEYRTAFENMYHNCRMTVRETDEAAPGLLIRRDGCRESWYMKCNAI